MGIVDVEPPAFADAMHSTPVPPDDIAAWLNDFVLELTASEIAPCRVKEVHRRLASTPFDAILAVVDTARTVLTDPAEIALYTRWIEANLTGPMLWAAWFNLGTVFARVGDSGNAAIAYGNALVLRPDMHFIAINLGLMLEAAGQPEQALATWQRATQPDAPRVALEIQQGRLLEKLGHYEEAEKMLGRVLLTDPAQPDVIHHWIHLRQKTCLWPVTPTNIPGLPPADLLRGSGPSGVLALTDDIDMQRDNATIWVARKTAPALRRLAPVAPYGHARIRIGYISSDFCSHAMSYLITELFERHDRTCFEVFGYCSSKEDGTPLRRRVLGAFDHCRFIRDLSDEHAAQLIRDDEIDILIELNGITDGSRIAILRWRPAPIQATYLGFVGPIPLPELDYVLCDNVVIPPEHECAYQPRPLPVARIYQANDSKRTIGRAMTRAEAGLPEDCFILCCFSKHYKITEEMFAAWMIILHQAENTVLWLATDNPVSQSNLTQEALRAGIAPERLIFSERADPDLYMSRLGLADLFLDTFPYNAGTVASDAIRMHLPIVTLCGRAFASRMATSLLHTLGAPQGITTSFSKYIETAVKFANDPGAHARYRARFTTAAWDDTIGNIAQFTKEFEGTMLRIVREHAQPADPFAEAIRLHLAGQLGAAEPFYRLVLASLTAPALASFNFALLRTSQGHIQDAIDYYCRAIAAQPDYADAYINLGTVVLGLGQREHAATLYRQAIAISPDNAMAHGNLGKALQDLGQLDDAIATYRIAIALQYNNPDVLVNFGAALLEKQDWPQAVDVTQQAILLRPDNAMAHANLGTALLNLNRFDEALIACRAAIALNPQGAAMLASLGGAMMELGEIPEAAELCRAALALDPHSPNAHFNLSHALKSINLLDEAADAARQAIALLPSFAQYHFHLAHILLLQGKLREGWDEYEFRWQMPDFAWINTIPALQTRPRWNGDDLAGKTILVITEQGLGDIVQFSRYLLLLAEKAGHVIVACNPATRRLLQTIKSITVVSLHDPLPEFDLYCPLMSLPRAFATTLETIPANVPYLHPDTAAESRWPQYRSKNLRVGIVWAGNPITRRDRFRSPGLANIAPLLALPGIDFVVLQMGPGRTELTTSPLPTNVLDLGGEISDLAETAAIMSGLDLIISSCTSPLHLAGALGVPCWGMIPFAPHFPWLLKRTDSLWYPTLRLYRQERFGQDWSGVVNRIATDLTALAKTHHPPANFPEKTLIFCTAHALEAGTWTTRYQRWLDAIKHSGLPQTQILLVDDGSRTLPDWPGLTIVSESDCPTPAATPQPGGALFYHFENNLGRLDVSNFPGWHRSFAFAALYAQAHGFDRVIHIESDAFLISQKARDYINNITEGWVALYSEKYAFPEIAINVAAGQGVQNFAAWARRPWACNPGQFAEKLLPFTHVERNLKGARYGEDRNDIPHDADFVAQTQIGREESYYWWMERETA